MGPGLIGSMIRILFQHIVRFWIWIHNSGFTCLIWFIWWEFLFRYYGNNTIMAALKIEEEEKNYRSIFSIHSDFSWLNNRAQFLVTLPDKGKDRAEKESTIKWKTEVLWKRHFLFLASYTTWKVAETLHQEFFCIFCGELECVVHSFVYVALFCIFERYLDSNPESCRSM